MWTTLFQSNRQRRPLPKSDFSGLPTGVRRYIPKRANNRLKDMSESSEEKVKGIIVEQLGVSADKVTREAKVVEDLGADSLDAVELVMAVEEEFGVEVPDDEAEGLTTVGAIIDYVDKASS